ncbi:MAG TPA: threonine-phosphate decarboxylase CobD [Rhizobiaceae bacterium]|nr:threonine-phosphate decarboxylase CobD [Rhizobiaceae bacterium]
MALQANETIEHGGNLARASVEFPHAPRPWIDLSTGINPHSYPLFDLPATALTRLPEPARLEQLKAVAAKAYGAPSAANVVAAPGTQILLPLVMSLVAAGRAVVLGPTYAEHAKAAALTGHQITETSDFNALFDADVAVVVNPNNPDGRIVSRHDLLNLATTLAAKGGLLVVDEAFMDVGPRAESVDGDVEQGGLVALRSFGKFFGLAGMRLGFAVARKDIAARLETQLGPWAVSGSALEYGIRALSDLVWQETMGQRLAGEATALDNLLAGFGLEIVGGTHLYRFVRHPDAHHLVRMLGERGILVRRFAEMPDRLRLGLPADEGATTRLRVALEAWARGERRMAAE